MGLIALILSVVIDAIWPLRGRAQDAQADVPARDTSLDASADPLGDVPYDPLADPLTEPVADPTADPLSEPATKPATKPVPHPLQRHALRLIDWISQDAGAAAKPGAGRQLSMPGWLVVVGIPVALVAIVQALAGALSGFFVLVLHVAVLYLSVGLGSFHRQFSELRLLVGAGEEESARAVLARWIGAGGARMAGDASQPLAGLATAHAILAAYRDVFAPLFWYAVLPGAIGPVLYLFARFAACLSHPFAWSAFYWLDWIPLRLTALAFALAGQFEDTIFYLRAVGGIRPQPSDSTDPFLHQRLLLLPVAGGALGLRLTDDGVDAQLRRHVPDLDLPGAEPEASSLRPVAGLLLRSGVIGIGIYVLVNLLG